MKYDLIVLGSGPGGYVAAIRASQLGLKTAIVEKENLGGVCLNWGCIPTKALLKSASVYNNLKHSQDYAILADNIKADFPKIIERSRNVALQMSKGIDFLMKKNKIDVIKGYGKLLPDKKLEVTLNDSANKEILSADNILIATGASCRKIPQIPQNGKNIIGYREALTLSKQPSKMIVVGSGAIGSELAYFYSTLGTDVTLVEFQDSITPLEDKDISKEIERIFKKQGIKVLTNSSVEKVVEEKDGTLSVEIKTDKGVETLNSEVVLSAVGIKTNIENIGLETVGIKTDKDKIITDEVYRTSVEGYWAIGDVVKGQALAHVASAEGICAVEKMAGLNPEKIDYENVPGCTYTTPQIASVGLTEKQAKEKGYELKIGKFPFSASGKAKASGAPEGFVKVIYDAKYGELLGVHMIGDNVTEMIAEAVLARKIESTGHEILKTIHPHPTMSEAFMEATAAAYGEVIHM